MSSLVTLYTTAGCHLCEQAEALLASLGAGWESVDIATDQHLLDAYGVRIPVIRRADGGELGWPFDQVALRAFLSGET